MTNKAPRLPSGAEALLAELPAAERDWEAQARAIDEKLATVEIGSTDSALLEAPSLAAEPGEPSTTTPKPSGTSLADLARSVSPRATREESNALFKQSLSVAAAARAQLPATVRSHATNAPTLQAPPSATPPRRDAPRNALIPFFAGAGVAIAAAAVVALVMRAPAQAPTPVIVTQAPTTSLPVAPVAPTPQPVAPVEKKAEPPEPASAPAEAAEKVAQTTNPGRSLEGAPPPSEKRAEAAPATAPARPLGAAKATSPKPERVVLEEAPPTPAPPPPSAESALRPASGASNTIPDQPSNGATQAALGSVLGAARACVAGMAGNSSATITFNADGRVAKVAVSGAAAGTPAGSCIQSALSRARVSPFTKPTFVVSGIAIRP